MIPGGEKVLMIAAQLYDMRRLTRSTIGDEKFAESVELFRPIFQQVERANQCNTLQAMKLLMQTCDGDAFRMMLVGAVTVELLEPSLPAKPASNAGAPSV